MAEQTDANPTETGGGDTLEDLFQQILRGSGIAFGAGLFAKAVGFVFNITLAQLLGASGYGLFVLGFTVVQFVHPVALLGIPDGIVRFVSEYRSENNFARVRGTILSSLAITGLSGAAFGLGLFLLSRPMATRVFNEPELIDVLPIFGIALPFYVLMQASTAVPVGFKRVGFQQAIRNILFPVFKLAFVGAALLLGYQLEGAVVGLLAAVAAASILGIAIIPSVVSDMELRGTIQTDVSGLLRYSLPVFLSGFSYMALNQIDRLILGVFRPSSAVGIYNASRILSEQGALFFVALVTIFNPIAADLYSSEALDRLQIVYQTVSRWILILTFPVVVLGATFATELLSLFETQFVEGVPVLLILFLAQLLFVGVGPAGELLQMSGFQNLVLLDTGTMLVANIVLNLLLIPAYGAIGAAVATAVSISGVQLAELYQTKRYVGIHPIGNRYFWVLGIGALFAAAAYGTNWLALSLLPRIGLAAGVTAVYAGLILKFAITDDDWDIFQSMLN